MSNEAMQQLADRWMNDPQFREEMRRDPEGTARRSGVELNEENRQTLQSLDWSESDQELRPRVSKAYRTWC